MTLSSLLVSRDWQEISVLECILGGLHIDVDVLTDPDQAWVKLNRSKVDALIVDRDLAGTDQFLHRIEQANVRTNTVPLVVVSAQRTVDCAVDASTLFRFEKPISVEQAVRTLSAARNLILTGRLRYHRHKIHTPVNVNWGKKSKIQAELRNVSQGGIGIKADRRLDAQGRVEINFSLPGSGHVVETSAQIAWSDHTGHAGLKFVQLPPSMRQDLEMWLAQRYFAH